MEDKELFSTVISSNEKKEYTDTEIIEAPPTELVGHDIQDYRKLNIPIPNFILERLFKERSINFLFGEKGKGKSMFALGLAYAMSHGLPFLNYKTPYCYPVILVDGEMDPYDLIERDKPFQETFGEAPKDYFHVVNWYFQKDQNIPDIKDQIGQDLITNYCKKVEELTNKPPFLILDNLRSLSNYIENDSDSWRPIGKWLLKLRGLGYTTLVLDHTGHGSSHMRGTSSKSDWANVCLKIESEGQKGGKIMKVKSKKCRKRDTILYTMMQHSKKRFWKRELNPPAVLC
jgi:RecA-family ATPase